MITDIPMTLSYKRGGTLWWRDQDQDVFKSEYFEVRYLWDKYHDH